MRPVSHGTTKVGPELADIGEPEPKAGTGSVPAKVSVRNVTIAYPMRGRSKDFVAVADATFDIGPSEMVCVVGPSGCGKSTVLSAVAGLVPHRSGAVLVDGKPVTGPGSDRAVVFQKASLLPWITVEDNVAYGLRSYGVGKRAARERARELLDLVGLTAFARSYPYQLSGGMQQRVNLARALAADPSILLLDEPFAALDAQQREILQLELLRIWSDTPKAGLFITHQIDEAVLLGNRVVVSSRGPASSIRNAIEIDLPWPRSRDTRLEPRFTDYVEHIWELLSAAQAE
ncbi:ABC transporter ATP-binding protein [Amycolatopsis pithecellobii]|uniref:ATP-binding cassette domain-containing protein n=1 Tax=Amycolatopsis pithecellobii TaxID=664692 RepID=A0A6N7YJP4_9PSEU|nr:ABC transporter ATP-binding protein [Amycolatopsis pithecellobii]MTD53117.1 ATP-binding cassette domain-containing protein [Amycolatopsis pithecellobii]